MLESLRKISELNFLKLILIILLFWVTVFLAKQYSDNDSDLVHYKLCQEAHGCVVFEITQEFVPSSIAYGFFPMDGVSKWPLVAVVEWPTMLPAKKILSSEILTTKENNKSFLIIRVKGTNQGGKLDSAQRFAPNGINGENNMLGMLRDSKMSSELGFNVFKGLGAKWIFPLDGANWDIYCTPTFKTNTCNLSYFMSENPAIKVSVLFDESLFEKRWLIMKKTTTFLIKMQKEKTNAY